MSLKEEIPIIVYDNRCYLCVKFAKIVNFLSRGKFTIIGHYTSLGQRIREEVLDGSALDMFWFIDKKNAFGGRAALLPLLRAIIFAKRRESKIIESNDDICDQECKTVKSVFFRSASLLSNSKKIYLYSKSK
jgi:hypothetical protein